ncbi:MAG: glycosyltransferase family 4 protein [Planctomycetota bacterium]
MKLGVRGGPGIAPDARADELAEALVARCRAAGDEGQVVAPGEAYDVDVVLALQPTARCDVYLPLDGLVADARIAGDRARRPGFLERVQRRLGDARHRARLQAERQLLAHGEGPLVLAVSEALRQRLRVVYPQAARRIAVVPRGVDIEHFQREPWVGPGLQLRRQLGLEGTYVALFAARDPWRGGLETALRAVQRARDSHPCVHLVVTGCHMPRALRRHVRRLDIAARVHALGPCDDLRPWLATADVLAHPTWYAPASPLVLEALAMSLPVITTPVDGAREVMGQRGGIVLEGPGEPEALAVAFGTLADEELRAFTREDARYVALRTRLATRLDQILDHCRDVLARRRA